MYNAFLPLLLIGNIQTQSASVAPPPSIPPSSTTNFGQKGPINGRNGSAIGAGPSSREHSEDEEVKSEGEDELVASLEHLTDPDEIKRIKRFGFFKTFRCTIS